MGEYRGTNDRNELGDIEVLYLEPSWHDNNVIWQSMAIAPLSRNEISFIMFKDYKGETGRFIRFVLTEEETDMLIDALIEAKKRWKTGRVY